MPRFDCSADHQPTTAIYSLFHSLTHYLPPSTPSLTPLLTHSLSHDRMPAAVLPGSRVARLPRGRAHCSAGAAGGGPAPLPHSLTHSHTLTRESLTVLEVELAE
jgi:hypothetical protein